MRISLTYGEDTANAYNRYQDLIASSKEKGFDILSITNLRQIVNQSLFDKKIVFTFDKPKKISASDWKWLAKNASRYNSNLLIYYEGNMPITVIKNLPKDAKLEKFDFPKIIFQFLDNFYPGNSKKLLKMLDESSKNEPIELIFHLLALRMRELYWIKASPDTLILPVWRKRKLLNQASKYSMHDIQHVISQLAEIDMKNKTSDTNLKNMLDILMVSVLK